VNHSGQAGQPHPFAPIAHSKRKAQSLVELAIILPLMVGIIAVLFQFGILFIAYLSLVHEMRDVGRWVSVHPDIIDGTSCASTNSLWALLCADAPSVVDPSRITLQVMPSADSVTRDCTPALTNNRCPKRTAGSELKLRLVYDASTIIFLPTRFRLGPWLDVAIKSSLPPYDYSVMVEQH
jgi:hypothetical protein